jgi:hypothetical protein
MDADPRFQPYFRRLKVGQSVGAVAQSMITLGGFNAEEVKAFRAHIEDLRSAGGSGGGGSVRSLPVPSGASPPPVRTELGLLPPSKLRKRAAAAGVAEEQVEAAEDSASPKAVMMALIIAAEGGAGVGPRADAPGPSAGAPAPAGGRGPPGAPSPSPGGAKPTPAPPDLATKPTTLRADHTVAVDYPDPGVAPHNVLANGPSQYDSEQQALGLLAAGIRFTCRCHPCLTIQTPLSPLYNSVSGHQVCISQWARSFHVFGACCRQSELRLGQQWHGKYARRMECRELRIFVERTARIFDGKLHGTKSERPCCMQESIAHIMKVNDEIEAANPVRCLHHCCLVPLFDVSD